MSKLSEGTPRPAPLRVLLALAGPMVLARASQSVITFADAIQVKHLGAPALAATATGGMNCYAFVILPMGLAFIVQSFVSQYAGRGERDATVRFAWYGLALSLVSGVIAAAAIPAVDAAMSITAYTPNVRELMAGYMKWRLLSVAAVVGVEALGNWYGGLGNTWMQMIAGIITMVSAVVFNWILIDGHLGAPAMGVAGAALASTIASWLGFAFIAVAFWRRWGKAPKGPAALGLSWRELGRVVRFGLPNGLNWFLELAAFQVFVNVVFAQLGDTSVAALNVVIAINSLSFMPAFGLASAGAILAGQAIGRGDRAAVWPQVRVTLACAGAWMGLIGAAYLIAPHALLSLFSSNAPEIVPVGVPMLMLSAFWQLFDATSMTFNETLRAAGDTTWTAAARLILAWAVFTPAGLLVVRVWHGGPNEAMLCLAGYIALLGIALALRFKSGAWKRIELIEPKLTA